MKAALLAVVVAGASAGALLFPRTVQIDGHADWRAVSQGLRRSADSRILAATPDALVHFHGVRGGIDTVELRLSSNGPAARTTLEIRRNEKPLFEALTLDVDPQPVVVPVPDAARDVDVALWTAEGGGRVFVHEVRLRRREAGGGLRLIPLLLGLGVLAALRRERAWWAALFAVGSVAIAAGALAAAIDPVSLLWMRPGTRDWLQTAAVAALAAAAVARAERRGVAPLAVVGAALILYAPTVGYGLVYDDFLWTRPWTLREVACTFVGSEDPTGVSNSYYRPWASTSHALEYALWGFRPAAFHAANVGLIALAGILAWAVFRRLPVSPRAALAGALVWVAHPMSASAVAWMSQRTDTLLACLYLATLWTLLARPFGRRQLAMTAVFGLLTFGAKELAVTLPLAALLLILCLPRDDDRVRRRQAVGLLAVMMVEYVAFWASLFPEKLAGRAAMSAGWGAFDPNALGHWLRVLPGLYGPLILPTSYEDWWNTFLPDWSAGYIAAITAVTLGLAGVALRGADRTVRRLGRFALAWPVLVIVPLLGLRGIDLYRGGLMIALGAGWLAVVVVHRLHERHSLLPAALAGAAVFALAPITTDAAAAWGPGGFYRAMTQRHIQMMPSWLASLQPHCRAHFWAQVAHDEHMSRRR